MEKSIKLTLVKPLIIESVKNETYFRGQVEKAADEKATAAAYNEQAGDDAFHLRILNRALYTNLSALYSYLAEYIPGSSTTTSNNVYSEEEGDFIYITLVVNDRFNYSMTDPLAKLCSKFIEESMLMDWWKPVNEKQSALYAQFVERDLAAIRRCFNKTAPTAPTIPYPTTLNTTGTSIAVTVGGEYTVTYTISEGAIDDIECRIGDPTLLLVGRSDEGFTIRGIRLGHTYIELYSRHNSELTKRLHVYVTSQT